jgi:hypothetical protein
MPQFYKILDLPPVPDHYEALALQQATEFTALPPEQRLARRAPLHDPKRPVMQFQRDGITQSGRTAPRIDFADIMSDWVNQHISAEWNQITIGVNLAPSDGLPGDTIIPHTDTARSYVLIYLLDVGNLDQDTVFFQEQGQAIHRKRNTTVEDFGRLIELERACYQLNQWAIMDATVLHDVENVQDRRTAIQIGFDIDPFGVMNWSIQ